MAEILSGREVAESLNAELKKRAGALAQRGTEPALAIIRVGENPGDIAYERGILKRCTAVGIVCRTKHLPSDVTQDEMLCLIDALNEDDSVHGVLLLRPFPKTLEESVITNRLSPRKDVDGMTDLSLSGLVSGRGIGFAPCTAEAAMAILDHYRIDCSGMRAAVIGRSLVFGKPAALMLISRNATVTVCHTRTKDLPSVTREADLLLVAAGHADTITAQHIRPGQIIIDVGINMGPDGRICGDVAFEDARETAGAITPVPGGVGAVTTSILARHVIEACEKNLPG